ncbi:putative leucine-rich repeat-containing, plant-type, leucine-rich repeat domain, L [Rosa chinensis]|uniref:Putative leucine-rich repeat-containing, plant-type, leucine-rich repeat domain, L n=1 Tax=Rosa chinensis TaxID=74649 RepID=A0A2P6S5Z5_ROSCH|nr:receptor-like protein 7 [Rosa chinensis]PRQ54094.1 putative leucine-rich repeat-containing, plant-type, leucine-rich repeat domain, L [Rosa chinensis]
MGSSLCVLSILVLVVLSFHFVVANSSRSLQQPSCHDEESSAMLKFKQSLVSDLSASNVSNGAYSKVSTWKPPLQGENKTCCSWAGVECDEKTGHVIGLDLSSSLLYGSINSNSTLFRLVHLERLNLADNNFNSSQIPPTIRNFPRLRYLNLSMSGFSGHASSEVSQLSQLTSLDLSQNFMFSDERFLRSLAQNLTSLEILDLTYMNISSTVPDTLANLSHLTSLSLRTCGLFGKLPFSLSNIRHLIYLDLGDNKFTGQISAALGSLTQLTELGLYSNQLSGPIPASLGNLTQLTKLRLYSNQLSSPIPASLGNLTRLTKLGLHSNNLNGSIPQSLFNLRNLQFLYLENNTLSGTVEFHEFVKLQELTSLDLSSNNLELTESKSLNNATTAVPKFEYLRLSWCNIREFPSFLRSQMTLIMLDLSGNKLQGQVPKWIWNTSTQTLRALNISHNFLSGFVQSPVVLPWANLKMLDLSFNVLCELLFLPSAASIRYYNIANNKLTGQVLPMICNLTSLEYLDLSNNKLIGDLPQCGENFSVQMKYLKLGNNSFHGIFPQSYTNGSSLRMMDISHNNFHGQLPRSLANCASLEILVVSHNKFNDTFPVWLGVVPELKILTMDHNMFYGVIVKPNKKNLTFTMLRILDLSYNNFSGEFPFENIFSRNGTSITDDFGYYYTDDLVYFRSVRLYYSITIMSKGVERYYPKIQEDLIFIDISSNNFEGKIPEFIGTLRGIRSLNISNNSLTDSIPSSLGNLSRLESLDLSHNKLSGEIPQQLAQLDFLTKFNVSYNNLTGPVPKGIHFTTFDSTSYQGNQGLCGDVLPKKCENSEGTQLPPSTSEDNDSDTGIELDCKFVVAGLASGLLVGVVLADFVITKWNVRFIEIVAVLVRLSKRMRRPRN